MHEAPTALRPFSPARPRIRGGHDLPMLAVLAGLVLLTTLFVTKLGLSAFDTFIRDADKSSDPSEVEVAVGPHKLQVPRNMIRFTSERGGAQSKVDLFFHWPSLSGFTPDRAGLFQISAADSPVIYATLRPADGSMSPDERFRTLYPRVLAEDMREEPGGVVVRSFKPGYGYDEEELYIARDAERPLVARCQTGSTEASSMGCMAEFRTQTGLDVNYRFNRELMEDWRELDAALKALVASFSEAG